MCGRVVWVWDAATGMLIQQYDDRATADPELRNVLEKMRYNVPPSSHLPVVIGTGEGAEVAVARWGFPIPGRPTGVFNTRIETAGSSPMWRSMLGETHCVFVVKGFYEWRRDKRNKVPLLIQRADREPMQLAGLYGTRTIDGEERLCASIATCEPNELMATVHDRMPVVLEADEAKTWLAPGQPDRGALLALADPAEEGVLTMHEVDPRVGSTDEDDPALVEPVERKRWF